MSGITRVVFNAIFGCLIMFIAADFFLASEEQGGSKIQQFFKNSGNVTLEDEAQKGTIKRAKAPAWATTQKPDGSADNGAGTVRLKAGRNGHFSVDGQIKGRKIPFLIDTGASVVSISYEQAKHVGIHLKQSDFKHKFNTANGVAEYAIVNVSSLRVGSIRVYDVRVAVSKRGGLAGKALLGNSFLSKLRSFRVENGTLILRK